MTQRERTAFLKRGRGRIFEHSRRLEPPSVMLIYERDESGLEEITNLK